MAQKQNKIERKWLHPTDVMKLFRLKQKKKALQNRISGNVLNNTTDDLEKTSAYEDVFSGRKRKNPFVMNDSKRRKDALDESSDQSLFTLFNFTTPSSSMSNAVTCFSNILNKINLDDKTEIVEVVKAQGETWLPIDWTLKSKVRLLSASPFPWNNKLKMSEAASGITAYTRCLDNNTATRLDTSPNAKFHQCCLYWQQPSLPWLKLFPRSATKIRSAGHNIAVNSEIKQSLQTAFTDSLRSLYQLIKTRQCPYFYVCANNFTILFRAAGICGNSNVTALITPTTRGFRQMLMKDDIEFTMPLKKRRTSDQGYDSLDSTVSDQIEDELENLDEDDTPDEKWLKEMGISEEDLKQINYRQEKVTRQAECEVDNSEQSMVLVEGPEIHAFFNFLINCKSITPLTGVLAGVPPTLLAPVGFHGATLNSLQVRESKMRVDDENYYSLELIGPILPSTTHHLFAVNSREHNLTMSFTGLPNTEPFNKIKNNEKKPDEQNMTIIGEENLGDCGLLPEVLKQFCTDNPNHVTTVECLKYTSENQTYTWR